MWGAGKRKSRRPARFVDYYTEGLDEQKRDEVRPRSTSTPRFPVPKPREARREVDVDEVEEEIREATREIEALKVDLQRMERSVLEVQEGQQQNGERKTRHSRDVTAAKSRENSPTLGRHLGEGRCEPPTRISANELRQFTRMKQDLHTRATSSPPPSRGRSKKAAASARSSSSSSESSTSRSSSSDHSIASRGRSSSSRSKGAKLKSGVLRKCTDQVKRKVLFPQERLPYTKNGGKSYYDLEWHECIAGSLDIILSHKVNSIESKQRLKLMRFMMFEVAEFGYQAVLHFNAVVLMQIEQGELDWGDRHFMKKVQNLKSVHLRKGYVPPRDASKAAKKTDLQLCYAYNKGECQATVEDNRAHSSRNGKVYHFCRPCATMRPAMGYQKHSATTCPYKDPEFRAKNPTQKSA